MLSYGPLLHSPFPNFAIYGIPIELLIIRFWVNTQKILMINQDWRKLLTVIVIFILIPLTLTDVIQWIPNFVSGNESFSNLRNVGAARREYNRPRQRCSHYTEKVITLRYTLLCKKIMELHYTFHYFIIIHIACIHNSSHALKRKN